jgi:SAM-dependent methyltransferase
MRADLLDRVQLVCPACTWKRESPAALRIDRTDGGKTDIKEGTLKCVRCGEVYPVVQGVAVLASEGYRRVAQEVAEIEDPVRLAGPHLLAHYGDLLPAAAREGLPLGDFWPRLAGLPASGLAVDLSCSAGRAALGLSKRAAFTLAMDASFVTARLARSIASSGRAPVRVVEEGAFDRNLEADVSSLLGGAIEFVVAEPDRPPLPPGIAGFVLAANLLERQGDPEGFVRRAASLLTPGGSLALASPYTWWEENVPREAWIGRGEQRTRDALVALLASLGHEVVDEADLLLLLREHARLEQVVRPHLVVSTARRR